MAETLTNTNTPAQTAKPKRTKVSLQDKVTEVVNVVVAAAGIELIELRVLRAPRNSYRVQLFIDRPMNQPGVNVDDCASISRKVGAELEIDDPFPGTWDLEVSSPGMNRMLRGRRDFEQFAGIRSRVKTRDEDGKKVTWIGELVHADETSVTLLCDGKKRRTVAYEDVERAELDPTIEQWVEMGRQREQSAVSADSNDR